MNIDDLTLGQIKTIKAMKCADDKTVTSASTKGPDIGTIPVLVCTDKRGVVFGYTTDPSARPIPLSGARMALYWSADVGGVFGLAEIGPTKGCKISAVVSSVTLEGVTAVFSVDEKAIGAWESAKVQGR